MNDQAAGPSQTFAEAAGTTQVDEGVWRNTPHPAYHLMDGSFVHGGYVLAVAGEAMQRASQRPDVVTVTCHFLERVDPTLPIDVHTRVVREGRRHSTVDATVVQDGTVRARLLGTLGDAAAADGPSHLGPPPECPDWEDMEPFGLRRRWRGHLEGRLHPRTAGFTRGEPSGSDEVIGRFRFVHDEPAASPALLLMSDILISPAVELGIAGMQWIPTVELTAHVHDPSHVGEVLAVIRSPHITTGRASEDVELWSGDGARILAVARQLALVRHPD